MLRKFVGAFDVDKVLASVHLISPHLFIISRKLIYKKETIVII